GGTPGPTDPTTGHGNAFLDVKARLRTGTAPTRPTLGTPADPAITDYSVVIDAVHTTGNADIRLWGSGKETSVSTVNPYPGGTAGKEGGVDLVYAGHGPLPDFQRFFRSFDSEAGSLLDLPPGVFAFDGPAAMHIDSTYDLRALDFNGNLWRPGITA